MENSPLQNVWSCGGGTQSAAIAALIVRGDLPKPSAAVIADTGREASETWRYYDAILKPQLASVGVDLVRLPHGAGWNTVDLFGGKDKKTALMPMFTTTGEQIGQTSKYCSNEWKSRPVERYFKSLGLTDANIWIGFSVDEFHRMRGYVPGGKWSHHYPLIDRKMNRGDCHGLVRRMGWPAPPRSSCWMCPYRTDAEWRHLRATDPADFEMAVELEAEVQAIDPDLYLHRSAKPLAAVNFGEAQGDLLQCASGQCFT